MISNRTYVVWWWTLAWYRCSGKRIIHQVIIIIIICIIIIGCSCGNNSHSLLLLNDFIWIQKYVCSHNTIVYSTNQLLWLNLCRYGMCTVRFGVCVHSCEQVSGIDGEERNLSSLSLFFPLSLSLSVRLSLLRLSVSLSLYRLRSLSPFFLERWRGKSLKFSLVRTHTQT